MSSVYSVFSYGRHPAKKGDSSRCHITRCCLVPEERLGFSLICLCDCGQEIGLCESLILYHKDMYIVMKQFHVRFLYCLRSLDTFINTYTPTPIGGAPIAGGMAGSESPFPAELPSADLHS